MRKPILSKHAFIKAFLYFFYLINSLNLLVSNNLNAQKSPITNWQQIDSLFQNRHYKEVIKLSSEVSKTYSSIEQQAIALLWLGKSEFKLGDYLKSKATLQKTINLLSNSPDEVSYTYLAQAYNDLGEVNEGLGEDQKALASYQQASALQQKIYGNDHPKIGETYLNISSIFANKGNFREAENYIQLALAIAASIPAKSSSLLADSYLKSGNLQLKRGMFSDARMLYQKTLNLNEAKYSDTHPKIGKALGAIGYSYNRERNLDRAMSYFQQSLDILTQSLGNNHPITLEIIGNIGTNYLMKYQLDSAQHYLSNSISAQQKILSKESSKLSGLYNNMGMLEFIQRNYDKALDWLFKAKKININAYGPASPKVTNNYQMIINVYFMQEKYDTALKYLEEGLAAAKVVFGEHHQTIADFYDYKSSITARKKDFKTSFAASHQAEKAAFYPEADLKDFRKAFSLEALEFIYINRIHGHYQAWEHGEGNHHLDSALIAVKDADLLVKFMRNSFKGNKTKSRIGRTANVVTILGLKIAKALQKVNPPSVSLTQDVLNLMEGVKYQQLLSTLYTQDKTLSFLGVPDSMLVAQANYQIKIQQLEQDLREVDVDSLRTILQKEIFINQEKHYALLENYEQNFPDYYNLLYQNKQVSIPEIQNKLLDDSSAIIEYYFSAPKLYSLLISKEQCNWAEHEAIGIPFDSIAPFIHQLKSSNILQDSIHKKTLALSKNIISVPLKNILASVNRLIFIPHGVLNYLPFEILPIPSKEKQDQRLIDQYKISYAYSLNILHQQMNRDDQKIPRFFAGFAPNYEQIKLNAFDTAQNKDIAMLVRAENYHLPGAQKEVDQISKLMNGDAFQLEAANERTFKKSANQYKILHLSMHALLDNQNPLFSKLLFSPAKDSLEDGYLYASELYNMNLNAELVVLSACNTGSGVLQKGEGISSLSSAFNFAGVPATVMSLWKVPDKSTSEIMISFYQYLKAGQSKDTALRQAKLDYLANTVEPDERHPYYWAGFVAAGDMRPIPMNENWAWQWWALGGLFLLGGLWWKYG